MAILRPGDKVKVKRHYKSAWPQEAEYYTVVRTWELPHFQYALEIESVEGKKVRTAPEAFPSACKPYDFEPVKQEKERPPHIVLYHEAWFEKVA